MGVYVVEGGGLSLFPINQQVISILPPPGLGGGSSRGPPGGVQSCPQGGGTGGWGFPLLCTPQVAGKGRRGAGNKSPAVIHG